MAEGAVSMGFYSCTDAINRLSPNQNSAIFSQPISIKNTFWLSLKTSVIQKVFAERKSSYSFR
ncbi:hypothetical protein FDUTEX481_05890 [Tolypothrix sp. PCC 7601]|nr:hypothetical protein FDUTEX481_05890 [Tolypothrix sp. PCC 7601]